jgi:hypothetical protein
MEIVTGILDAIGGLFGSDDGGNAAAYQAQLNNDANKTTQMMLFGMVGILMVVMLLKK